MITRTGSEVDPVLLTRSWKGSIDCVFAPEYSKVTALNLGLLCMYAYKTFKEIESFLNRVVSVGGRDCPLENSVPFVFRHHPVETPISGIEDISHAATGLSIIDTQAFSFQDPENLYFVFRGTQELPDWLTDFYAVSIPNPLGPGNVHKGFSDALMAVLPKLKEILGKWDKKRKIVVCGHSLGGALASLCAAWIREAYTDQVMLYSYASPRAGCRNFVNHYTKTKPFTAYRIANPTDMVPAVPWSTGSRDEIAIAGVVVSSVVMPGIGFLIGLQAAATSLVVDTVFTVVPDDMLYIHLGVSVSLRPEGITVIGNPASLDGEFLETAIADAKVSFKNMPLTKEGAKEFVISRGKHAMHHFMAEYMQRLQKDFVTDCKCWADNNPSPYPAVVAAVDERLKDLRDEIFKEEMKVYAPRVAVADATRTKYSAPVEVTSQERLDVLKQVKFGYDLQRGILQIQAARTAESVLPHLTTRKFDGYLEEELLFHAGLPNPPASMSPRPKPDPKPATVPAASGGSSSAPSGGGSDAYKQWMDIAEGEMGVTEIKGAEDNPRIVEYHASTSYHATEDETAWCSSYVNWVITQAGFKGTNSARALDWVTWKGGEVLDDAILGSLGVIKHPDGSGHVGFVVGETASGWIQLLGGNQGNMVKYSNFERKEFVAFVWPQGVEQSGELPKVAQSGGLLSAKETK